jgi:hypothetical protein
VSALCCKERSISESLLSEEPGRAKKGSVSMHTPAVRKQVFVLLLSGVLGMLFSMSIITPVFAIPTHREEVMNPTGNTASPVPNVTVGTCGVQYTPQVGWFCHVAVYCSVYTSSPDSPIITVLFDGAVGPYPDTLPEDWARSLAQTEIQRRGYFCPGSPLFTASRGMGPFAASGTILAR